MYLNDSIYLRPPAVTYTVPLDLATERFALVVIGTKQYASLASLACLNLALTMIPLSSSKDPDAPSRSNPIYREFVHWVVVNIPGNEGDYPL